MNNVIYVDFEKKKLIEKQYIESVCEKTNPDDIFDHYDKMLQNTINRFGQNQPRGGCSVAKSIWEIDGIKSLESYGRGDIHNSTHRYSIKEKLSKVGSWNRPIPFMVDLKLIEKTLIKNKNNTLNFGLASDPFQWMDRKYQNTLSTLKLANKHNVKLIIHTMSDLCAHEDYIEHLRSHEVYMFMGVKGFNEHHERILSPGAPSLLRRQKAIDKLKKESINVTPVYVSIKQFLKEYPNEVKYLADIKKEII